MMRYALIDWDNTIRKDYTLFCWVDYLAKNNIIKKKYNNNIIDLFNKYSNLNISHEELAEFTGIEYSKAIMNIEKRYIESVSKEYINTDKKYIHSFAPELFKLLHENGINPIIISGSPKVVLSNYFKQYKIKEAYCFENDVLDGKYTGKVKCNYGFDKWKVVEELEGKLHKKPYLAIGDSESDFPMLDAANYSFIFNRNICNEKYNSVNEKNILASIAHIL